MDVVMDEKALLECFRDSQSTTTDEKQVLQQLSQYPHPEQVREIEDCWVGYNTDNYQFSLLHYACWKGWNDVSRELVDKYQCDPHLESSWKWIPLHCACMRGSIDIVRFLIVDNQCEPTCHGREGKTPLHIACASGKVDTVKFLVEECHCDPGVQDEDSYTLLHHACAKGSIEVVRFLIGHHFDPACCGREGRTPLHCACWYGKWNIVRFLVEECHCDPGVQDKDSNTPLHYACEGGSVDIVRFLIVDHHCDPACCGREGITPLHCACKSGNIYIVRFLVEECRCDPRVQDKDGNTPLHYACVKGSIEVVRFLIVDHHCDPACCGREGITPLHCACKSGNIYIVRFLVEECRCDPRVQDKDGNTPLHYACVKGSIEVVRLLILDYHCDPAYHGQWWGRPPLYFACVSGKLDIVKFLVEECHCDPRSQYLDGNTPLHYACVGGSIEVVRFLIADHHCDPTCHGQWGRTPLHYACASGKLGIVKFLVEECYCDPRVQDLYGNTPLYYACAKGSIDLVKFLIFDHQCDPACCDVWGQTPLYYACENGKMNIVKFLMEECHCDPRVQDTDGNTPIHLACRGGSIDIVRFLIVDHHCDPGCHGQWGQTPLHYACENGKLNIVKFFVEECHCDPRVQDTNGSAPIHLACGGGSIDIVRFLIVDRHCDPACRGEKGRTPLHYACGSGKLDIVKFLVEECHCDPIRGKDDDDKAPLHLAAEGEHEDIVLFLLSHIPPLKLVTSVLKYHPVKLLQAFKQCRTEYPLESAFKIFVLGNHAAGKTTLVKVIENEITNIFGSLVGQWRKVSKAAVVPLTAGIIPVSIESRRLGQIMIYDMAGHYQYYSSHAALLRSLVSSSASMFLVVVNLNQEKEEIIRQLQYWDSFVDNCCSSACRPLTVTVFSHADKVTEDKPKRKSSEIVKELSHSKTSSGFSKAVTLDCRKLASRGLTEISRIVAERCVKLSKTFQFDFAVQLLYAFISSSLADRIAFTVSELQLLIKQKQGEDSFALKIGDREILSTNATELSQYLTMLSDKGQFLFLRNDTKVEDSWVVINKGVLLSEVNGTVFAPDNFKQHYKIANSTGVVPFSKIRQVFSKQDSDMVVAFLQHLEFCQEISEAGVSLITSQHFRCSCGPMERFFFFPALVSEEKSSGPSNAIKTPSYRCEWTLQSTQPHKFFTPQFLHVLLLRLAFSFALAPDDTQVQVSPVLERRCFVWRNGIRWLGRDGVETTVEETKQNSTYIVTMQCISGQEMECTQYRSQVVRCILDAKEELCPTVEVREFLIYLDNPATGLDFQHTFSVVEVAKALAEDKLFVVSQPGGKMVRIDDLLYFEPYAYVSAECLFTESNLNKVVSEEFLDGVNKTFGIKVHQLKQVLGIKDARLQAVSARAPSIQQDLPEYQCKLLFQVWKESTQSPTYRALRSALDKYSVFCGRNPLVSCSIMWVCFVCASLLI